MPRLLGEFLHEQQEPFALDAYLLERGYSARTISRRNRSRFFVGSLSCTEFAKAVFCRLVSQYNHSNIKRKIKNPDKPEEINNSNNNEQVSLVSVLEETESDIDDEENHNKFNTTTQEEYTHIHRCVRQLQEVAATDSYDQYIINKKILRQTKQLLIDCVREVIEQHRKRDDDGSGLKKILGTDELWKLVCENVWLWSLDSIHETNVIHMLRHDIMACAREWNSHPGPQKEEISMEIGDAILECIIGETFC